MGVEGQRCRQSCMPWTRSRPGRRAGHVRTSARDSGVMGGPWPGCDATHAARHDTPWSLPQARPRGWQAAALAPGSSPVSAATPGVPPTLDDSDAHSASLHRSGESEVLSRPPKTELHPVELINVFGYHRDMHSK